MGLSGWSYGEVLPYFKRSETLEGGGDDYHGSDGPLYVSKASTPNPIFTSFIKAGAEAGYKVTSDFNGYQQEGFGPFQLTIKDGQRWSAARGYLHPVKDQRPNLVTEIEARTTKIIIENGRAVGVAYVQGKKQTAKIAYADSEVLLCAGAVQSPQILQLSGIGDPEALAKVGVPVVHALKGVGKNLQDHLDVVISWECPEAITAYSYNKGLKRLATGLNYLLRGQGPGRQNFLEAGAFLKSRPDLDRPDLQLHCVLAIMKDHGKTVIEKDGFSVHVCQLRPESRGEVALRSADPFDDPAILANYLATDEDRRALREGVKMVRALVKGAAMDAVRGEEFQPGEAIQSDADLDAWIRETSETIYHPVGTCRMGAAGDDLAVVDETLCVHGLKGLRVVDASVMPTLVGGNTNGPTIMIAEKAADMILGRAPMAAVTVPVFEDASAA
jgi:choline dehydrogenase